MHANGSRHTKLDRAALLERFDGDVDLLRDIADTFLAHCPDLLAEIGNAVTTRDAARLCKAAHNLKGTVANFEVEEAVATAFRLERMGMEGELGEVEAAWDDLQTKMRSFQVELAQLVRLEPRSEGNTSGE